MDFRKLELFLAVMDTMSVTKAAEKVHLSPGAVSLQLRNLSEELNTDLFVRQGKHLQPTDAALHLLKGAKLLIAQVRTLEQDFINDPTKDLRPVHFATGATALINQVGTPLRLLRKRFPKTTIQITVTATEQMVLGLRNRTFDLALITLPYPTKGLKTIPLFEEELIIIRPSPSTGSSPRVRTVQAADLRNAPFVLHSRQSNMRLIIDDFFDRIAVKPTVIMEADDAAVLRQLVESGFGYSILPASALRRGPKFFQIQRVKGEKLMRTQALAMPASDHPRAIVVQIAQTLASFFPQKPSPAATVRPS